MAQGCNNDRSRSPLVKDQAAKVQDQHQRNSLETGTFKEGKNWSPQGVTTAETGHPATEKPTKVRDCWPKGLHDRSRSPLVEDQAAKVQDQHQRNKLRVWKL